ncbi:MAG TPA: hypothetical protein VGE01_01640 [Fimbriimonas sp.]
MHEKVSATGIFSAVGMTLVGTIGHFLTQSRGDVRLDWIWIAMFVISLFTLSGAVVNFDPKRILK